MIFPYVCKPLIDSHFQIMSMSVPDEGYSKTV
jgi:hypothetical protein